MKKELLALLLCAAPSYAGLEFDWSDSSLSKEKRQQIETTIKRTALLYTEENYADLGVYNFLTAAERYSIHVESDLGQAGEYWMGAEGGELFLDESCVKDQVLLEIVVFHEFSHAYDYTVTENIREMEYAKAKNLKERRQARQRTAWLTQIIAVTEQRALKKEQQYVEDIKLKIPKELYQKLQDRYKE